MVPFILRRLLSLIPTVLVAFTLTFLVVHATPGSPWDESEKPLPEAVKQNLRKQYHLDDPLPKQYFDYLASALHGDFGPSYRNVLSVSEIIQNELPISIHRSPRSSIAPSPSTWTRDGRAPRRCSKRSG